MIPHKASGFPASLLRHPATFVGGVIHIALLLQLCNHFADRRRRYMKHLGELLIRHQFMAFADDVNGL